MFDIKDLIEKGINKGVDEKKLLMVVADEIKKGSDHDELFNKIYSEVFGPHLCDQYCKKMVDEMYNAAGEKGCKFTTDQVIDSARRLGITFSGTDEDYTEHELWCAANMIYYDYGHILKEAGVTPDVTVCTNMADSYLDDIDAPYGKLANYFFFLEKHKEK